jgi:pimeloyl-ACP methyl ester carboxylesterase
MTRLLAGALALAAIAAFAVIAPASAAEFTKEDRFVTSSAGGVQIDISVFKPAVATPENRVPVILFSHGWGGSKADVGTPTAFLDAGFGVVSFSQRGFGASGGQANVQDPDLEAEDVESIIDYISTLDWVQKDLDADGLPIADDPVLGAIGGSYGGGYQTMTALDEIKESPTGTTRLNALTPEISWYDLNESLAPQKVVRTVWSTALFAVAANVVPDYIKTAFAWGAASGQWPDGKILGQDDPTGQVPDLDAEFHEHSPVAFAEDGIKLNIPVIVKQGQSDNLFNLNQGLHIFRDALTPAAQAQSYFIGFNGGHALPEAFPLGAATAGDPCSGNWTAKRIEFFKAVFAHASTANIFPKRYNMADVGGTQCLSYDANTSTRTFGVNDDIDPTGSNGMVMTAAAGPPVNLPIVDGPITVSGIPTLSGDAYFAGVDTRTFFGLSMGPTATNGAGATVIGNNMMPLRLLVPDGIDQTSFNIELPGVTAKIPAGQSLYLTISPISDMSFGHGSHVPGGIVFTGLELKVPTL